MTSRACFIGRWQTPKLHEGHTWLIDQALSKGKPVLILVRDCYDANDPKNPYLLIDVMRMIQVYYIHEDVVVRAIPDIESINYGRDVGYAVIEHKPPEDISKISATSLRHKRN